MTTILLFSELGCIINDIIILYTWLVIILVWMGYSKIEMQCIRKNYHSIFKLLIPSAVNI